MSQNDFVIANAAGAAVRSDMNSAFQALASLSGGTSAPGTIYANQLWFDTTNDLLKIRDEANTSWVTIASLVGTTWTPYIAGTAQGNMSTLVYSAVAQAIVMSAKQIETAKATVATATTPNLSTAAANAIEFTGTTTVTGFTTGQAGTLYYCEYPTGAGFTLTYNATSLITPTAASITVGAGDSWFIFARGSNNVRIMGYQRADGSSLGGAIASQAQMEAASSNVVSASPGRLQYHPGVPKCWHSIDGTGTVATRASHNITSVTDNGSGDYTSTIATDFSSSDWIYNNGWANDVAGNNSYINMMRTLAGMAAGTVRVNSGSSSNGANIDIDYVAYSGKGDQ